MMRLGWHCPPTRTFPPTLTLPHAGGGERLFRPSAWAERFAFLPALQRSGAIWTATLLVLTGCFPPPAWGRVRVGGLA